MDQQTPAPEEQQARLWGALVHVSAIIGFILLPSIGNILGPLIIWLIKKDQIPFVHEQGKESMNFQISMSIYLLISGVLSLALVGIPFLIGFFIADVIYTIVAAIQASDGRSYHYPLTIRFIS